MFGAVVQIGKVIGSALVGGAVKTVVLALTGIQGMDADGTDADDEAGEQEPEADMFNGFGLVGRPRPPDADGYAEHASIPRGDRMQPVAYRDPRLQVPNLKEGANGIAGYGGAFFLFEPDADGNTGTATLYVPYAFVGGTATKAMTVAVNVQENGEESIQVIHGDGMALSFNAATGGISARVNSSSWLDMKPGELAAQFASISLKGNVSIGDPTLNDNVVLGVPLIAWANAVSAILAAPPVSNATIAAATAALVAAVEATRARAS